MSHRPNNGGHGFASVFVSGNSRTLNVTMPPPAGQRGSLKNWDTGRLDITILKDLRDVPPNPVKPEGVKPERVKPGLDITAIIKKLRSGKVINIWIAVEQLALTPTDNEKIIVLLDELQRVHGQNRSLRDAIIRALRKAVEQLALTPTDNKKIIALLEELQRVHGQNWGLRDVITRALRNRQA